VTVGDDTAAHREWRGIHVTRGMRLQIPAHSIRISAGADGEPEMSMGALNVSIDLYVHWLEIALEHVSSAESAHATLTDVWDSDDTEAKSQALELDFVHSMQSVVAAAVAVDAFYALIRQHVEVPEVTLEAWRRNRTSRPSQVSEVFRLAFELGPKSAKRMRSGLRELYQWRDWAVHPKAGFGPPVKYDELGVATEWRLVAFQSSNARGATSIALSIIAQLQPRVRAKYGGLKEHCDGAVQFVVPLVDQWETRYGPLYERESDEQTDEGV